MATPEGYEPNGVYIEKAKEFAQLSGPAIEITSDINEAVRGANVLYTGTGTVVKRR
jgi:ornithine carbamoyltransferase